MKPVSHNTGLASLTSLGMPASDTSPITRNASWPSKCSDVSEQFHSMTAIVLLLDVYSKWRQRLPLWSTPGAVERSHS